MIWWRDPSPKPCFSQGSAACAKRQQTQGGCHRSAGLRQAAREASPRRERLLLLRLRRETSSSSSSPVPSLMSPGKGLLPRRAESHPAPASPARPSPRRGGHHGAGEPRAEAGRLSARLLLQEVINSLTCRALTRPPRIDRILLSCNEFYGLFQYILAMFLQ